MIFGICHSLRRAINVVSIVKKAHSYNRVTESIDVMNKSILLDLPPMKENELAHAINQSLDGESQDSQATLIVA